MISPQAIQQQIQARIDASINRHFNRPSVNAINGVNNADISSNTGQAGVVSNAAQTPVSFQEFLAGFASLGGSNPDINPIIDRAISDASIAHGIDANLIRAVIRAESSYNPFAVSSAGAMGLMQLMPGTARSLGVTDPFDIWQNVNAGTEYLSRMLNRFNGDIELALAAYNAGAGAVERHGGIPPFAETQTYVPRVLDFREQYILSQYQQHTRLHN